MRKTFNEYLDEQLKDPEFKKRFEEEREKYLLSSQIRSERKRRKLTQKQLAKITGLTRQEVSKLETAISPAVTLSTIFKIVKALDLNLVLISSSEAIQYHNLF